MKKTLLLFALLLGATVIFAQDKMLVHTPGETIEMVLDQTDSLYFTDEGTVANFRVDGILQQFYISEIDSITFDIAIDSTVFINYSGNTVAVINPLEPLGVVVDVDGSDVTVNSTADFGDIKYILSGTTYDGMFKIYSNKKFDLFLSGVQISNNDGPAINVQSSKKVTVHLETGTENVLTDGVTYAEPPNMEDQEAAFFSEGQLVFEGTGTLAVNGHGTEKHGIRSDDYIEVNNGDITVSSAELDGIHGKDGFYMNGGSVDVTSSGDGIDGSSGVVEITAGNIAVHSSEDDVSAIQCDSTMLVSGGTLDLTVAGDRSKGLQSVQNMMLSGGNIEINTTGGIVLIPSGQGFDPTYCTAIKGETQVIIEGSEIAITSSGEAGRGITCEGDILISSGIVDIGCSGDGDTYENMMGDTDAYHASCINADGSVTITGGEITIYNSGDGGKGISTDGEINIGTTGSEQIIDVTTTGNRITIEPGGPGPNNPGVYDEAKAVTADGAITIESGTLNIDSADDGIKSTVSVTIYDGQVSITESIEAIESPFITVNGGDISLKSSDDGFNATHGNGGEGNDGSLLSINGGYSFVNSTSGDPVDSNGDIAISGGILVVHGPQSSPEVGMDVNGACVISGGFIVISGTNSNMTEGASSSSTQPSVLLRTNQGISANTIFHIEDSNGNSLLNFAPMRTYYSIIFSSDELNTGTSYKVYTGGTCTGSLQNGLYTGGTYTGGTLRTTFTLTNMAQTVWF